MPQQKDKTNLLPVAAIAAAVLIGAVIWAVTRGHSRQAESSHLDQKDQTVARLRAQREAIEAKPKVNLEGDVTLEQIVGSARTWMSVLPQWRGQIAPYFALKDITGKEHQLSDYYGKNILLLFWGTWCPPCRAEIPDLILLRKRLSQDELAILAVTDEKAEHVRHFVAQAGINYTVLLDTGKMPAPFGVQRAYRTVGVPCSFIIDPNGKIKIATAGTVPMATIRAILRAKK